MIRAGQRLYEERIKKGLTLEEVSKATKIRANFLLAIEKGEYNKLPSSAYVQGFVRNYAEFLGLPKKDILALFRREFDEEKIFKVLPEGLTRSKEFPLRTLRIQQAVIVTTSILLLLLGYLFFQYRYAIINPPLEITAPKEGAVFSDFQIRLSGKTDPNATVSINGQGVTVDNNGNFVKTLDVFSGKSTISITATNRFGKETKKERHIEVK